MEYRPLFQYFGGKSAVAAAVWNALGDVWSYVEPFFGSGAVLFNRPHAGERREVVNDADGYVANFWRAVARCGDEVAHHADWPCNENDLTARHIWLVQRRDELRERLEGDPDWCDPKIAGWWVWGMTWWIGGGWCSGDGPWTTDGERIVRSHGTGVSRRRPCLISSQGVSCKIPYLTSSRGVNRKCDGTEVRGLCGAYSDHVRAMIGAARDRLRRVYVCCGDWSRVCTPSAAGYCSSNSGRVGIFLDPPYSAEANRDMGCYATDCGEVAHKVREWCREHGDDPRLRIILCGYEGEHDELESMGWRVVAWETKGGMANTAKKDTQAKINAGRERMWLSPACLDHGGADPEGALFRDRHASGRDEMEAVHD